MSDDSGHPKFTSRRQRRRGSAGADGTGTDGTGADASGWLTAQFQATGNVEQDDRHDDADATGLRRGTAHSEASGPVASLSNTPSSPTPLSPGSTLTEPPVGGFRWGLKPQAAPATSPVTPPAPLASEPPARPEPEPVSRPVPDPATSPGMAGDPFLPADPNVPIVPPELPVVAGPDVSPAALPAASAPVPIIALPDSFVVPPPDRVLPTELFSPVQPGELTEPLVSRRTFRPRVLADPDRPGSDAAPVPLTPAEPTVRLPSVPLNAESPLTASGLDAPPSEVSGSGWLGNKKFLFWAGGAVLVVLALVGLFYLGTRLPELFGSAPASETATAAGVIASAAPSAAPTPSPSTAPVTEVAAVGPLAPGTYPWEKLRGGECLSDYKSPWAEKFSVVDCAVPHPAQMVHRGTFGPDDASSYPGLDTLQAQINLLCSAPTVIDFAAARAYTDIRVAGSFAATSQEWDAGHRDYFCFVTRGSGDPLAGNVAAPVG
ncbi:MAG: hypothetical protein ABI275_07750 [Terrimesophilobacter sp.]